MNYSRKSKIAGILTTLLISLVILSVSVLRCATPRIAYSPIVLSEKVESNVTMTVDYLLAYPGKIGPDNTLWYGKVMRDKVWYFLHLIKIKIRIKSAFC